MGGLGLFGDYKGASSEWGTETPMHTMQNKFAINAS